jgi:NAD-dependent dihydropyrimidine dehydrogenase PreA subunit
MSSIAKADSSNNIDPYAEYDKDGTAVGDYIVLTEGYNMCPNYNFPLIAVSYNPNSIPTNFGCYTLEGTTVVINWDDGTTSYISAYDFYLL